MSGHLKGLLKWWVSGRGETKVGNLRGCIVTPVTGDEVFGNKKKHEFFSKAAYVLVGRPQGSLGDQIREAVHLYKCTQRMSKSMMQYRLLSRKASYCTTATTSSPFTVCLPPRPHPLPDLFLPLFHPLAIHVISPDALARLSSAILIPLQ